MIVIPLVGEEPHYKQQVELEGSTYGLELQWNFRDEGWYVSLYDSEGDAIWAGLRLVVDFPLGTRCADARKPPGIFQAQDTSGAQRDATFEDLGQRVKLYYFEAGELDG